MNKLPASTGWTWIREGFGIFRKQPGALMLLMLAYLVAGMVLGAIPLIGQWATLVLAPVFTAVFVQACAAADRNQRLTPELLAPAFRKPAFPRLAGLGALFVLVLFVLILVFSAIVGGDTIRQIAEQQLKPDPATVQASNMGWAMFAMFLLSLPITMAMLFAPPLIFWQQMGVAKALFYSFFAVWRAVRAFVVFFVCWMGVVMLTTNLTLLIVGKTLLGMAVLQSLLMVILMVLHCSVYAAYRSIFGEPAPTV